MKCVVPQQAYAGPTTSKTRIIPVSGETRFTRPATHACWETLNFARFKKLLRCTMHTPWGASMVSFEEEHISIKFIFSIA